MGTRTGERSGEPPEPPRVVLLGNAKSKRAVAFLQAAAERNWPTPQVVDWCDWLDGGVPLEGVLRAGDWLRIDSTGESWDVERRLLERGAEPVAAEGGTPMSLRELALCDGSRGEIHAPRQWYLGMCAALEQIRSEVGRFVAGAGAGVPPWNQAGCIRWFADPSAIRTLFDKGACQPLFEREGLPVPAYRLNLCGYEALRAAFPGDSGRLMIKLRHGFSAMGAIALEWQRQRVRALTTTESVATPGGDRLYLSKKLHSLVEESQIARLVDRLAPEGLIVERWLPKDRLDGLQYDLRALVVDGELAHVVGRGASGPFTNLNLDARRIDADRIIRRLGARWDEARSICERAGRVFPSALAVGVDLLIQPQCGFALLEANAFGDNLPGVLHAGLSTHAVQLQAIERRLGQAPAGVLAGAGRTDAGPGCETDSNGDVVP